jgi:hypothetical protein
VERDERKENALKYMPESWNQLFRNKHHVINETLDIIKRNIMANGLCVNFRGQTLYFHCLTENDLNVDWIFSDINDSNGTFSYDKNLITLSTNIKRDGLKVYETLHHEFTHKLQSDLVDHMEEYSHDSPEYEYLKLLQYESKHKQISGEAFGKSFVGDSYLNPVETSNKLLKTVDFAIAAYDLQISERSAMATGYNAYEYALSLCKNQSYAQSHKTKNPNTINEAFDIVRKECGILSLSQSEIRKAFDDAKLNIILQRAPTKNNDLEAMITYKLATFLRAQNSLERDVYKTINEYALDSTKTAMKHAMLTCYETEGLMFVPPNSNQRIGDFVFVNDLFEIGSCNSQTLQEMTEYEQIRNPRIIAYTIALEGADVVNYINDIEAFQLWYYSDMNDLSPGIQETLSEILGIEYSPEFREKMKEMINERFAQEMVENVSRKCFDRIEDVYLFENIDHDDRTQ